MCIFVYYMYMCRNFYNWFLWISFYITDYNPICSSLCICIAARGQLCPWEKKGKASEEAAEWQKGRFLRIDCRHKRMEWKNYKRKGEAGLKRRELAEGTGPRQSNDREESSQDGLNEQEEETDCTAEQSGTKTKSDKAQKRREKAQKRREKKERGKGKRQKQVQWAEEKRQIEW